MRERARTTRVLSNEKKEFGAATLAVSDLFPMHAPRLCAAPPRPALSLGPPRAPVLPRSAASVVARGAAGPDGPGVPSQSGRAEPGPPLPPPSSPDTLPPSIWALKPPWCQPWSILGTGAAVTAGAASLSPWAGGAVGVAVAAWWWLFLVAVPADYASYRTGALRAAQAGDKQADGTGRSP